MSDKKRIDGNKTREADRHFDRIEYYFRNRKSPDILQSISDQTINDIDFKSVFSAVDHTCSRIGQQYLFNKLLTIKKTPGFSEQEDLCEYFNNNSSVRSQVQGQLLRLNDENAYHVARLFLEDFIDPPKYFPIIIILSLLGIVSLIGAFIISKLLIFTILMFCINMAVHYVNKKYTYIYSDSIPQLSLLCKSVKELIKLKLPVNEEGTVEASLRSIEQIKSQMRLFTLEAKSADIFQGFIHMLSEYVKIQFLLEPIIVFNVLKKLDQKKPDIQNLFEYFGKIDCATSVNSLRENLEYFCKMTPGTDNLEFADIYHPLVNDCVPNDMQLNHKSILLTGSNMSGKTTFIRSITINLLFAQTINTCFASYFQSPPMRIFSAIRISDDVLSGKSYYFEEVLTINEMIKESRKGVKTLFLLDEIFKGTNTIERIAAGKAVLSYLSRNGNIVFVSTHDIELTELLQEEYELFHFTEEVIDGKVHFDYKLKAGELKTRNAIRILEINGYPVELIEEAKAISMKIAKVSEKVN